MLVYLAVIIAAGQHAHLHARKPGQYYLEQDAQRLYLKHVQAEAAAAEQAEQQGAEEAVEAALYILHQVQRVNRQHVKSMKH
jgi:hypothetical protein